MAAQTKTNTIQDLVSSIVSSSETQDLFNAYGLKAQSVTWEDTARTKGSCWGPNISDMTLIVKDGKRLMPVVRKPNFSDVTQDVPIDTFKLRIGNQEDKGETKILSLQDYLKDIRRYLPDNSHVTNLHIERDSVILTSSQCCVLPVKKGEKTEFALQLFNYQSYDEDPAVLVILASRKGTSAQILERSNQKLFFNDRGTARWFNVERLEDARERKGVEKTRVDSFKEMKDDEKMENTIMMIQVPLKQKPRAQSRGLWGDEFVSKNSLPMAFCGGTRSRSMAPPRRVKGHGMDMGQIGLGSSEGKYIGTKGIKLVRDERFPIRCTFQYYRVTDENFVTEKNIIDISDQLNQAAKVALASGSLVLNEKTERVTEPDLDNPQSSDDPLGKLDERDYLKQSETEPKWNMASFT